eukprot:CAMPEP_0174760534 /NCGR_PEP_ID=MMETSP1094-20130205/108821_1 /TAXON_ID=156173 /ORGANISM="Chrysochromulina brevifilum, Strain UTEX LB 985" /LENGTH=38 /DNA_ID= /DNA_START= /DNA_END= /DNA_ORIENTATION=
MSYGHGDCAVNRRDSAMAVPSVNLQGRQRVSARSGSCA